MEGCPAVSLHGALAQEALATQPQTNPFLPRRHARLSQGCPSAVLGSSGSPLVIRITRHQDWRRTAWVSGCLAGLQVPPRPLEVSVPPAHSPHASAHSQAERSAPLSARNRTTPVASQAPLISLLKLTASVLLLWYSFK